MVRHSEDGLVKDQRLLNVDVPERLRVSRDLIRFNREGRTLLVDGLTLRPLLVNQGADGLSRLLELIDEVQHVDELLDAGADVDLLRALLSHGILVSVDSEHLAEPTGDTLRVMRESPGMSLYLLLAQDCNLGCVYCLDGRKSYRFGERVRMSPEIAFRAVERCLERIASGGTLDIIFFGGEPLLNWPLAKQIIMQVEDEIAPRFADRRVRFNLTSNLLKLPADLIEWLKDHSIGVLCDVDGPPECNDLTRPLKGGQPSTTRVTANVQRLVDAGVPVALRATITSRNVDRMGDIARFHKELGGAGTAVVAVNAVNSDADILNEELLPDPDAFAAGLREMLDVGWDIEQIFPFNQIGSGIRPDSTGVIACGAPWGNTPVVDANGDVYACIYLVGMSDYRTGNVLDEAEFPAPEVVSRMLDLLNVDHLVTCKDCAYRYVCLGGCPVSTLTIAANPKASERVRQYSREIRCKAVRAVVEESLWRIAEKALYVPEGGNAPPC